jgi:hypothetical protein
MSTHIGFAKQAAAPGTVTQSFKVTASPNVMGRFERFLALVHWNSAVGHSATVGMPIDGDGPDAFAVKPDLRERFREDLRAFQGNGVECAGDDSYYSQRLRR